MTALERAKRLREQLELSKDDAKHHDDAKALEQMRAVLEQLRTQLLEQLTTASLLVTKEVFDAAAMPALDKLQKSVRDNISAFDGTSQSLRKSRRITTLEKRAKKVIGTLEEALTEAWANEFASAPSPQMQLLGQIEKVPGQAELVARIRAANTQLQSFRSTVPTHEETWTRYLHVRDDLEVLLANLGAEAFPASALAFCKAAQAGGASVDMLTDEVREWLEQHELLDSLRIRFV
ncbi:hypothetical protein ENSA5_36030 [Enhygromyxa salina]|uniref:Uncharacterized protein n=1 Tax=Enhygromyxa salina TaxID=215803 RepID=A0A2S9XUH4_9BACT|nr:hypothetical protein [Enhygromyxa salina]PRP96527.1 hypothetical protein ENSA5_36030 [Enhygromyxa salina]